MIQHSPLRIGDLRSGTEIAIFDIERDDLTYFATSRLGTCTPNEIEPSCPSVSLFRRHEVLIAQLHDA